MRVMPPTEFSVGLADGTVCHVDLLPLPSPDVDVWKFGVLVDSALFGGLVGEGDSDGGVVWGCVPNTTRRVAGLYLSPIDAVASAIEFVSVA